MTVYFNVIPALTSVSFLLNTCVGGGGLPRTGAKLFICLKVLADYTKHECSHAGFHAGLLLLAWQNLYHL